MTELDQAAENYTNALHALIRAMNDVAENMNAVSTEKKITETKTVKAKGTGKRAKSTGEILAAVQSPEQFTQEEIKDDPFSAPKIEQDDPFSAPAEKKEDDSTGMTFAKVSEIFFKGLQEIADLMGPEASQNVSKNLLGRHIDGKEFNADNVPVNKWLPLIQDIQGTVELAQKKAQK